MPRKIRQLVQDLQRSGFLLVSGGKGSHRKFKRPDLKGAVILSGQDGQDAKPYQEKMVQKAMDEALE